jgi:chromosome segregation ATPase
LKLRKIVATSSDDNIEINKQLTESSELLSGIRNESRTKSATIETLKGKLNAKKERITTLNVQLSTSNSQLKESKKLTSELQGKLTAANKKINILEINAAKDEAIIDKLRAEKAYWNRDTAEFESKQKLELELKSLRDKLNSLID